MTCSGASVVPLWCLRGAACVVSPCHRSASVVPPWHIHGRYKAPMVLPWEVHGAFMEVPWSFHGPSIELSWRLLVPWGFRGAFMLFPWGFHGESMVSWFHCAFWWPRKKRHKPNVHHPRISSCTGGVHNASRPHVRNRYVLHQIHGRYCILFRLVRYRD